MIRATEAFSCALEPSVSRVHFETKSQQFQSIRVFFFINSFWPGHNDLCWTRDRCILRNPIHFAMPSDFTRCKSIAADDFHLHANVFHFHECPSKFIVDHRSIMAPNESPCYVHISAEHSSFQSDCPFRFDARLCHKHLRMDSHPGTGVAQGDYNLPSEPRTKSWRWGHSRFDSSAFVASRWPSARHTCWSHSRMGANRFEGSR